MGGRVRGSCRPRSLSGTQVAACTTLRQLREPTLPLPAHRQPRPGYQGVCQVQRHAQVYGEAVAASRLRMGWREGGSRWAALQGQGVCVGCQARVLVADGGCTGAGCARRCTIKAVSAQATRGWAGNNACRRPQAKPPTLHGKGATWHGPRPILSRTASGNVERTFASADGQAVQNFVYSASLCLVLPLFPASLTHATSCAARPKSALREFPSPNCIDGPAVVVFKHPFFSQLHSPAGAQQERC